MWQNGRCSRSYDKIGPCLGSGGMGGVWAARVREGADSSGCTGSWVAVKVIPVDLAGGTCEMASVQSGLRECLSTFRDLSPAHVVCYENYWMEEPSHLPPEVQQFCERRVPSAPRQTNGGPVARASSSRCSPGAADCPEAGRTDSGILWTSLRFQENEGCEMKMRCSSDMSHFFPPSPIAGLNDSLGFVWEEASADDPEDSECSECTAAPRQRVGSMRLGRVAIEPPPITRSRCVVLLIEMELMGRPPDTCSTMAKEERLTLRAWLQRDDRTLSDAVDVFGSLILSVRHIHRKRIVHADLKPDNIFCETSTRRGAERAKVTAVRIGDFGLAYENPTWRGSLRGNSSSRPRALGGTPGYVAPEVLRGDCSDKADIFACAVILLELLMQPLGTQMEWAKVCEKFREEKAMPEFVISKLPKTRALLLEMGAQDPAARLSAEEVSKRVEKEVRKELYRATQALCSPNFEAPPQSPRKKDSLKESPALRCSEPEPNDISRALDRDRECGSSSSTAESRGAGRRQYKGGRKGRRR